MCLLGLLVQGEGAQGEHAHMCASAEQAAVCKKVQRVSRLYVGGSGSLSHGCLHRAPTGDASVGEAVFSIMDPELTSHVCGREE